MELFAERLHEHRKRKGWSQERLAREAGLSLNSIHHAENGSSIPRLDSAIRIARALGVSVDELAGSPREAAVSV